MSGHTPWRELFKDLPTEQKPNITEEQNELMPMDLDENDPSEILTHTTDSVIVNPDSMDVGRIYKYKLDTIDIIMVKETDGNVALYTLDDKEEPLGD